MVDKERELNELKKKYSHLQDIYTIVIIKIHLISLILV